MWMRALCLSLLLSTAASASEGQVELSLSPIVVQVNSKFVEHAGSSVSASYLVREHLALTMTGMMNWHRGQTALVDSLIASARAEPQAASQVLLREAALLGMEMRPGTGELTAFGQSASFQPFLSAGFGAGGATLESPLVPNGAPVTLDVGPRFVGSFALGVQVSLSRSIALRLEAHDVFFSSRIERVCSAGPDSCTVGGVEAGFPVSASSSSNISSLASIGLALTWTL